MAEPAVEDAIRTPMGYTLRFGRQDDIPVPAKYNDDDKTDQAVYRPGEGGSGAPTDPSSWYWCPSNNTAIPPSCEFGGYGAAIFGQREDVPLPGLELGGATTRYLAVYRPSNGTFYWAPVGGGATLSRQVAVPGSRSVPLPGKYDADDLTDFATYDVLNARFDLVLSSENWSVATKRVQAFPSYYRPTFPATGTSSASQRSGAVPVGGVRTALSGGQIRSTFAVFDAASNRYAVSWDTLTTVASPYSVSPQECYFLSGVDIPLAGLGGTPSPRDTLAGLQFGGPATLRRTTPTTSTCGAGLPAAQPIYFRGDGTAAVVPDVSGDSLPDILLMDPELPLVRIIKSNAGFTTTNQVYIGGPSAQLL